MAAVQDISSNLCWISTAPGFCAMDHVVPGDVALSVGGPVCLPTVDLSDHLLCVLHAFSASDGPRSVSPSATAFAGGCVAVSTLFSASLAVSPRPWNPYPPGARGTRRAAAILLIDKYCAGVGSLSRAAAGHFWEWVTQACSGEFTTKTTPGPEPETIGPPVALVTMITLGLAARFVVPAALSGVLLEDAMVAAIARCLSRQQPGRETAAHCVQAFLNAVPPTASTTGIREMLLADRVMNQRELTLATRFAPPRKRLRTEKAISPEDLGHGTADCSGSGGPSVHPKDSSPAGGGGHGAGSSFEHPGSALLCEVPRLEDRGSWVVEQKGAAMRRAGVVLGCGVYGMAVVERVEGSSASFCVRKSAKPKETPAWLKGNPPPLVHAHQYPMYGPQRLLKPVYVVVASHGGGPGLLQRQQVGSMIQQGRRGAQLAGVPAPAPGPAAQLGAAGHMPQAPTLTASGARTALRQEISVYRALGAHPHILRVLGSSDDTGETAVQPYLLLEFCHGELQSPCPSRT
jgi:hypothetical protein